MTRASIYGRSELRPVLRLFALVGLVLLFALIPLWSPSAQAQAPLPGSFAPAPCPFGPLEGLTIDCGYLTVIESRRNPTERTIQLAVAILRSPNPNKDPNPALFLSGGPGQPALPLISFVAVAYTPILLQRDIVLIDQRGTGYSQPALNCPSANAFDARFPLGAQPQDRPELVQFQADLLIACGREYQAAGVDLEAYNSVENAADLEDLRVALGVSQWNLLGASYGTRLALTAMRYRPETIRSAVLDSAYPLDANFHVNVFESYDRALGRLFAACAATPECNTAYPNLAAQFEELIPRLNAEPIVVPLVNPQTGEVLDYLPVTGVDVSTIVFQLFYSTLDIPALPLIIGDLARGDTELFSLILSILLLQNMPGAVPPVSQLMQTATQCNEDVTFAAPSDFVAARDAHRRASALAFVVTFNEAILEVCAALGLGPGSGAEDEPVFSDVPTLIISGEFDPITPPSYAYRAGETLSESEVIVYPHGGHTPSTVSPCLVQAMTDFYANPQGPINTACIANEAPIPFFVR